MKWHELKNSYTNRVSQMAKLPPHELLGVPVDASKEEVKAAYLELVKAYHPDKADPFMARHNGEMIKLIIAAYDKLKVGG
jgi:curved DNA-binding protein CbpA